MLPLASKTLPNQMNLQSKPNKGCSSPPITIKINIGTSDLIDGDQSCSQPKANYERLKTEEKVR